MKKSFKLLFAALMALAMFVPAQAAEWTAADGSNTGEFAPVYGYNFETDQHNQMQYPAAELTGIAAGTDITAMKFYTSTPDAVNALGGSVTVSLANINEATPWSVDAYGYISGSLLDVPVTAVATLTPAADEDGVWTITFDAPFTYTGGALLVDVQTVAGDWKNTEFYGKEMDAFYVMSVYGYSGSKKGQRVLPKTTITFDEGGQEEGIALLAEANALEDNSEFTFDGDAVVTAFFNNYLFLRDESGYAMISGVEGAFANGQVLSHGWSATKTSNDGWVSYTDAAGLSASGETNADLAAAQKLTAFPDESMLNAYVYVENVNLGPFPPRTFKLPDGTSITKSEMLGGIGWSMGGNYNVYGVIVKDGGVLKLNPIDSELYVEPEPEVTDKPVITYVDDPEAQTVTVTATGNGHICLYWDDMLQAEGEGTAEWVIAYGDDPEGEEYGISATAQEDGKEVSEYALATVFVPGKPVEPEVLRGDVNKDKVVNIADVTALIDMLLNGAEMIPEADCNLDNVMTIADVTALIDVLLSGTWPE